MDENLIARFWRAVDSRDEPSAACWEWQGPRHRQGYGIIHERKRRWLAHRLSWAINRGPLDSKTFVLHRCDNPACVRPSHLFTGSQADNVHDMCAKGRRFQPPSKGSRNPASKLNEEAVKEIRRLYREGTLQSALSAKFGVSLATVSIVVRRLSWKHVR